MPLMEVVLTQRYQQQACQNRWNYLASGTPASVSFSYALVSALGAIPSVGVYPVGELMQLLTTVQDNSLAFELITAKDVYSATDFYSTTFVPTLTGGQSGNGLSPASAFGFRTNRTRLDIRRGSKRFTGITVTALAADNTFTTAYNTQLGAIATKMSQTLEYVDEGNTLTFQPVIVGRHKYSPSGNPAGPFAYEYYEDPEVQMEHLMSSITWDFYPNIRTQVSRQIGRGS